MTLVQYLEKLPRANEEILGDIAFYGKNAKAEKYALAVSLDTSSIQLLDLSKAEWLALLSVKGVLRKEVRSGGRKKHDGKRAKYHYRLQKRKIREILFPYENDHGKIPRLAPGIHWLSKKQWLQECEDFCQKFNCRLELEPADENDQTKVYTHGDVIEYLVWCQLGEKSENWRKNCRSYKKGTDCGEYEIKSACSWFSPSAIWIGKNQHI